jgi:hypothetical protein
MEKPALKKSCANTRKKRTTKILLLLMKPQFSVGDTQID